jgi:hypothetical protein
MRPVLAPAAVRLWRDDQTLQLGRAAARSAVLAGLDPTARAALALLDGTRDEPQVIAAAAAAGCPPSRTHALLTLLASAGLLEDAGGDRSALHRLEPAERRRLGADVASLALLRGDGGLPALRHRADVHVLVAGGGRVGAVLAGILATAGLGGVDVVDEALAAEEDAVVGGLELTDVGRRRGEAARDRIGRWAPTSRQGPLPAPDLVVLAPSGPAELAQARRLVDAGTPHLLAEVRETTGVVGPLVLPRRTTCLRCVDLTRADLDPDWPALATQLTAPARTGTACDAALAVMVAAQAALQVLALADATTRPAAIGGTLELALPDWRWRRRSWPAHPACCGALAPAG